MTAISKAWVDIVDGQIDPESPLDTALLTAIRDALVHLREWLGASYVAGAVQDHNHDGVNSAAIEVGPNFIRNGSFESGTAGWDLTPYTGGTIGVNTANDIDGQVALAITVANVADGGGDALSPGFVPVTGDGLYSYKVAVKASTAGVSAKALVRWFDDTQSQISESTIFNDTSTPTSATRRGQLLRAPTAARYCRVLLVGGVPTVGTSAGTIYFDGVVITEGPPVVEAGTARCVGYDRGLATTFSDTYEPVKSLPALVDGFLTVGFELALEAPQATIASARIYVNGVAVGTERTSGSGTFVDYTEVIPVQWGDFIEIYAKDSTSAEAALVRNFRLMCATT